MRSIKILTAIQWICFLFTSGLLVYLLNPTEDEPICNISYYEKDYSTSVGNAIGWEDKISDDIEQDIKRMTENPIFNQFEIYPDKDKVFPNRTSPPVFNNPYFYQPPIIDDSGGGKVCTVSEPSTIFLLLIGVVYGIYFTNRGKKNTRNKPKQ